MRTFTVILAVCVLAGGSLAVAANYSENWNTDPGAEFGGWTDDPGGGINHVTWLADGGVGNSGHLVMERPELTYPPYFCPSLDPAKSGTSGNVNATYGATVTISLDIWAEDGNPPDEIGYGWWIFDTAGGLWYKNLYMPGEVPFFYGPTFVPGDANLDKSIDDIDAAILSANWLKIGGALWEEGDFNADGNVDDIDATLLASNWGTVLNTSNRFENVTVTFDTTWSDAEANAEGFYKYGSTTSSWTNLMSDVKTWNFGGRALNYSGGGPYTIHMDNFEMMSGTPPQTSSVPEPSLLILIAAGLPVWALLRRRVSITKGA